jgi:pimeloyl-ACP methyl ester carboxylesterase
MSIASTDVLIVTGGQRIRVRYRRGVGVPLVMCNGIGAGLEVLEPVVEALDPRRPVIRFDAPGCGASPTSPMPYGFPYLAWILGRVLNRMDIGVVDVLGFSWGGTLAQQFAFQNPMRCRVKKGLRASADGRCCLDVTFCATRDPSTHPDSGGQGRPDRPECQRVHHEPPVAAESHPLAPEWAHRPLPECRGAGAGNRRVSWSTQPQGRHRNDLVTLA